MSVLDLRDAYHTLPLAEESQKYCRLTPYYGSPTYVYLRMGMGMSCSPALWQQFVHIIWEQLPNKERYKIIMDDILIFSTRQQYWEDLENLFHVLIKFGLKISPHKCQLFRDKLVYMGLEFLIKDGTAHYTAMPELLPDRKTTIELIADKTNELQYKDIIGGQGIVWVWSNDSSKPLQPVVGTFHNDKTLITFENTTGKTQYITKEALVAILDMRSKEGGMTNFEWDIPTDDEGNLVLYAHTFASSLELTKLANEDPALQAETKIAVSQTPNNHTIKTENTEDPYPRLDVDDPRRTMTDEEILRLKVPFDKSILSAAEKERLVKLMLENTAAFSIRDEIGTCPYFEVKLKLRDDKPFFVRLYNIREDQKPIIQKEMDRLEKLGIIRKGLTGYSSPVLLVKRKQQNLYRVVTDFRVLNERLV